MSSASSPPVTVRVVDLETTGSLPPEHAVGEIGWQDVERAGEGGPWQVTAEWALPARQGRAPAP